MISVDEARSRILQSLTVTRTEVVPLPQAWGRVLALPVVARLNHPAQDVSAMDGFALRVSSGEVGAQLRLIGTAPAGHPFEGQVGRGEAVRIFTGSVVPAGADTILLQEDAKLDGEVVQVGEACIPGRHIRPAGQDFRIGDVLLQPGRKLGARDIGLAAAGNHSWLTVRRRPRIGILATGDEIGLPGDPIPPGGLVSSNSHALSGLIRAGGGDPVLFPIAPDDLDAIRSVADDLDGIDLLVTTGGASVGDHDLVQAALASRGMQLDFWKVAMRPGKPLISGCLASTPLLGLPGNPVSALVCGALFLLPAIESLSGRLATAPKMEPAVLGTDLPQNDKRADFLRAELRTDEAGRVVATPFARQDSGMLSVFAKADALIVRLPHAGATSAGSDVQIIRLDTLGL